VDLLMVYIFVFLGVSFIILSVIWPFGYRHRIVRLKLSHEPQSNFKKKLRQVLAKIFPFSQKLIEKLKMEAKLKNTLDAAHIKLAPAEFFNIKLMIMGLVVFLGFFFIGKLPPAGIIIALAVGYIGPDLWLHKRISQRKEIIGRLLPETVDLLGLCVEAGLDFTTAVRWIIEKTPINPMLEELSFVLEEIKWGKPRTQALRDMSKRLNVPEVSSFVQTLVQAERMGTPVADAFTILSEDTRLQRFHQGERFAMKAPIKILLPLIFCILPVIGIIIGGPIFLQFMQGGMLKGIGG